jgi:hypothetical protein
LTQSPGYHTVIKVPRKPTDLLMPFMAAPGCLFKLSRTPFHLQRALELRRQIGRDAMTDALASP